LHWKSSQVSFGAFGDSFYEYELKLWLQGGKKEKIYREMYDKSIEGMHTRLLKQSPSGLWYIASQRRQFEHLTCFMGGVLALGGKFDGSENIC
jgi:mannosyl-oligosaccharide alpha-1,2-mannosidase